MTALPSRRLLLAALFLCSGGCASFTNPVADGIPVSRLPDEVFGRPRAELQPVPLNLLRQKEPESHVVDKGDVLAIVCEEILGKVKTGMKDPVTGLEVVQQQPPPVQFNNSPNALKPAFTGYPIPVQDDGNILLPDLPPLHVKGKTLVEVQKQIVKAITVDKKLVVPGKERVLVDLIQPRQFQVLVVREDTQGGAIGGVGGVIGANRKGAGFTIKLDAYKNDLLRALNATGGPPGLDAKNEVVIRRGQYDPADPAKGYVRIPLRVRADEPLTFTEADIVLGDGDTVFIEARDTEAFYTAGLLGSAQVPLPRDYDLRVIEAITQVRGPLINGSFNQNQFTPQAVNTGIGNPNASLVTVVRNLPNGQRIRIRVDLNTAFRDLRENILIQPGDILVMQEKPSEAGVRYLTQTLRLSTTYELFRTGRATGIGTSSNP
jgi:protein involved in polysaccharide export with SLBB domain